MRSSSHGKLWSGVWRVADPKITLASVASMTVGATAAAWQGPIAWPWLALTVIGMAGCGVLAFTLPLASVGLGAGVLAVGAPAWVLHHRRR